MKLVRPKRARRSSRPWVIPPGLLVLPEPFEGFQVLDETRSELGVLLWQSLRDVDLWAATPPDARPDLFTPNALGIRRLRIAAELAADSPIRLLLEGISEVLSPSPGAGDTQLSELCESVSRWASDMEWPRTALAFAQRSALAAPEMAGPAYLVALVARRTADYRRSETWFRRSLALARRNQDWKYYGLAHMGLANLHMQRGDAPSARSRLLRALRAARRYGVWSVRPFALHDLFCIAATASGTDGEQAEAYARAAYRGYGRRHPRLPALAHDVAWFWMLRHDFERALPVFRAVLRHVPRPTERMVVLSNVARAAAGAGDLHGFEAAWKDVWRLRETRTDGERVAEAMVNLAHGALAAGDLTRLEMAASHAIRVATLRDEAQHRMAGEDLLARGKGMTPRRRRGRGRGARHRPPLPPLRPAEASPADRLASALVQALQEVPVEP